MAPFVHCTMHGSEVLVLELEAPIERIKSCDGNMRGAAEEDAECLSAGLSFTNSQFDWYSEVLRLEGECEKQYRLNLGLAT